MRIPLLLGGLGVAALSTLSVLPHGMLPGGSQVVVRVDSPAALAVKSAPVAGSATSPAAPVANVRVAEVSTALAALTSHVQEMSSPDALKRAMQAYYAYRAAHPERVKKPYLYYVDYGLDGRTPRGYVFDMEKLSVVEGPFAVAAGRGSVSSKYGVPMHFSNASGSAASSLGLFVTQESYGFTGHTGGRAYSAMGMRIDGVSGRFNDAARARKVVVHGAPYVTVGGTGRSEGCPAMDPARARRLIPLLREGSLVFLYSPNDRSWVHEDPWANAPDFSSAPVTSAALQ